MFQEPDPLEEALEYLSNSETKAIMWRMDMQLDILLPQGRRTTSYRLEQVSRSIFNMLLTCRLSVVKFDDA